MHSPLETAISNLGTGSLTDALRELYIVSRRVGASTFSAVLRSELDGYDPGTPLPAYRDFSHLPVTVQFDGPGGYRREFSAGQREFPESLRQKDIGFYGPVAELEALVSTASGAESDPRLALPMAWVGLYRDLLNYGTAPGLDTGGGLLNANRAFIRVPGTHLAGVVDRLRVTVLDLALDLEAISQDIGTPGGPTLETDPRIASALQGAATIFAAAGSTVVVGDGNVTAGSGGTILQAGDVDGLLQVVGSTYSPALEGELRDALEADGGEPAAATRSLLERVKAGSAALALGMTGNAAYDGLVRLLVQVFPAVSL